MTPLKYLALALTVALLYAVVRLLHPRYVNLEKRLKGY